MEKTKLNIVLLLGCIALCFCVQSCSIDSDDYIDSSKPFGFYRSLLMGEKFDLLERNQRKLNELHLNDRIDSTDYFSGMSNLWYKSDYDTEVIYGKLKKWVAENPQSAYANYHLGQYLYGYGFHLRGGKYRNETSNEKYEILWSYIEKAEIKIEKALQIDSNLMIAYSALIYIYRNGVAPEYDILVENVFRRAREIKDNDYTVWVAYMESKLPRWGGSYQVMKKIHMESKSVFSGRSARYADYLEGIIYIDEVNLLWKAKNNDAALEVVDKAIGKYPITVHPRLYYYKAVLLKENKEYEPCSKFAHKAIESLPYYKPSYSSNGFCQIKLKNWLNANDSYIKSILLGTKTAYGLYYLGVSYLELGNIDAAYTCFKLSEKLDASYIKYTKRHIEKLKKQKVELKILPLEALLHSAYKH